MTYLPRLAITGSRGAVGGDPFLVSFREADDRLERHFRAVDAAADAGVSRIVYLSFLNAPADSTFILGRQHHATEEHIKQRGGMAFDFVPFFTGDDGVIRAPAGIRESGAPACGGTLPTTCSYYSSSWGRIS